MARYREAGRTDPGEMARIGGVPGAVIAVVVPRGKAACLSRMLDALRGATGPAGLALAPGALAVLVLSAEPEAVAPVLRAREADFPHPMRLHATAETPDDHSCVRLAARLARLLGVPDAPLFLLDARCPPAPGWLYGAAAALRDGATAVRARRGPLALLGLGPAMPRGVSGAGRDLFRPRRPFLTARPRLRPAVV